MTYQALKEKHGKKIADQMRVEKRKIQAKMDEEGSTDRPVVKASDDLPDCEELFGFIDYHKNISCDIIFILSMSTYNINHV